MKKHAITALAAALCLLCTGIPVTGGSTGYAVTASAADEEKLTYGDLTYAIEDESITITGCDTKITEVEIPQEIDGKPVTKIGATAFYGCALTGITIPEGITTIQSGAFWHSKSLAELHLPSTLTTIENFAFADCKVLENIEFPESLSYIGNSAFLDTPWLAAQQEASPYVIVNGILIDATAAVSNALDEINAKKQSLIQELEDAKIWHRPEILTNQVGYFPNLRKQATIITDATTGVSFSLLDESGTAVFTGTGTPHGADADSGDTVQILDFSEFKTPGTYTLQVGDAISHPFKIGVTDDYSGLTTDALNFFYQQRSGIAIEEEYITSGIKTELARDAGHPEDIATIQHVWGYGGATVSSGTQDVTGGWYDAGDHGKYVVNGGVSLWTMQNEYERALLKGTADVYADGTMSIPENSNGYPDLLDEARWEMEWMLKMIVQDGDCAGMVYHKVHDEKWTAIGTNPASDMQPRVLMPPTTAATLNFAAVAAQSYRLWKDLDPDFAGTCLDAARTAYTAAKANPEMYAPLTSPNGGGPYGDEDVTDEFYWAACELFAATGDQEYYDELTANEHSGIILSDMGNMTASFDWGATSTMGSLTLLLHKDMIGEDVASQLETSLVAAADTFVALEDAKGYGDPYQGATDKNGYTAFVWGSNSFTANNAIIMAYAYDETQDTAYLNGVVSAMDYLLGRNPLDISYVTGYGMHTAQYPHHRWWAKSIKDANPKAPCGVLVGGPNSNLEDEVIQEDETFVKGETPALLCYLDDIGAYSVNECAINWNTPLAWVSSYLCEQNGGLIAGAASTGTQLPEPEKAEDILKREYPIEITLPDGVTAVGEQIFGKYKDNVTAVTVPDSVTAISKEAFYRCGKLETLELPETITAVGSEAFGETPWLTAKLAESPLLILNDLLISATTAEGDVVIPDGVTTILGSAFYMNTAITSVTVPEGVTSIGESAFYGCEALTSISLPDSLERIGNSAFNSCGLTELTIPRGVKEVGEEAFVNCTDLPAVTILSTDALIGREAFGCTSTFTLSGQYSYFFVHLVLEDFVVKCYEGSTAAAYAGATGLQTEYLAAAAPTLGDVDGSGKLDIIDVIKVNKYILGSGDLTDAQKTAADVDASGIVDETDSLSILKAVVGLITL